MSSLLPLIQDLLPMILPAPVQVVTGRELEERYPTAELAITQRDAIIQHCDKMCASVLIAKPHTSSSIRHHGEQDTIIYAVSGTGVLLVKPGFEAEMKRHELAPGDFAFVPAWTEHQMLSEMDQDVVWVVVRSGPRPVVVDLTDWGGDQKE